jgi:16S rRNA U516 pseudouridylate synthase RsuA-like enzyme
MKKPKRKLTAEQRRWKRERKKKYMIVLINGKQKRIKRPPTIEGLPVEEFIRRNADPVWLHQNEMWEYM